MSICNRFEILVKKILNFVLKRSFPFTIWSFLCGFAHVTRAPAADHAVGEIGEDRRLSNHPLLARRIPIVRGGGAEGHVPKNLEPD